MIKLNRVVLPAPLGPIIAFIEPGFSFIETSLVAIIPPKLLVTFLSISMLVFPTSYNNPVQQTFFKS